MMVICMSDGDVCMCVCYGFRLSSFAVGHHDGPLLLRVLQCNQWASCSNCDAYILHNFLYCVLISLNFYIHFSMFRFCCCFFYLLTSEQNKYFLE